MTPGTYYYQTLKHVAVKNNAGTGLVGYQVSAIVRVQSTDGIAWLTAEYIINPDGTRKFVQNSVCTNAGCLR